MPQETNPRFYDFYLDHRSYSFHVPHLHVAVLWFLLMMARQKVKSFSTRELLSSQTRVMGRRMTLRRVKLLTKRHLVVVLRSHLSLSVVSSRLSDPDHSSLHQDHPHLVRQNLCSYSWNHQRHAVFPFRFWAKSRMLNYWWAKQLVHACSYRWNREVRFGRECCVSHWHLLHCHPDRSMHDQRSSSSRVTSQAFSPHYRMHLHLWLIFSSFRQLVQTAGWFRWQKTHGQLLWGGMRQWRVRSSYAGQHSTRTPNSPSLVVFCCHHEVAHLQNISCNRTRTEKACAWKHKCDDRLDKKHDMRMHRQHQKKVVNTTFVFSFPCVSFSAKLKSRFENHGWMDTFLNYTLFSLELVT